MGQTLLEQMSVTHICVFAAILFSTMVTFFIVGGTKGADPGVATIHIANLFQMNNKKKNLNNHYSFNSSRDWVWYRTNGRNNNEQININRGYKDESIAHIVFHSDDKPESADDFILSTKFPHPGKDNQMHRVYQFMVVVMTVQMEYMIKTRHPGQLQDDLIPSFHECIMSFNAKLGYSDKKEVTKESDWKLLNFAHNQLRPLTCKFTHLEKNDEDSHDGYYSCDDQHLFELGSVAHKHYILNLQFPNVEDNKYCLALKGSGGYFGGIHLTEIHQNGGYTISLFVSKTVMFPFIVGALMFFVSRVKREKRPMILLEKSIIWLGSALAILLLPIDWLTLVFDMPFMLFFSDLRQGFFYAAILVFWSVFAGEHILDQQERNNVRLYKYEIGLISAGCFSLFVFDSVDRGFQISNPFHTIWKKDVGETVARVFLGVAAGASILFCLFFIRLLYLAYRNISLKEAALPAMQEDRRLYYQNRIYRIRVLLWVTLGTVVSTVICFVLDQVNETSWKFEEHSLNDWVIVSSALHFGMFGMWGTYVFAVLILYSPVGQPNAEPNVEYRAAAQNLLHSEGVDDSTDGDADVLFTHPKT